MNEQELPLWDEKRQGARFKELLRNLINTHPLGTTPPIGPIHVKLMKEVVADYEAERAVLRARVAELEAELQGWRNGIPFEREVIDD
jgi:hypothetical protein